MGDRKNCRIAYGIFGSFILLMAIFLLPAKISLSKYVFNKDYTIAARSSITFGLSAIGAINGTTQIGQILTAGAVTPAGATAAYQWQRCIASDGIYADIPGATSNIYTLVNDDYNYYIRVVANGTGSYSGTEISAFAGPVTTTQFTALKSIGTISGTARVGNILTAGAVTPAGATVTYQWMKCSSASGTYTNIDGATSSTYTLTGSDYNYYIKVSATGIGVYTGTVTSKRSSRVTAAPLTGIGTISGTAQVGQILTAGALTPANATANYRWQRCSTQNGTYVNITGATSSTYTLTANDYNKYIRVRATGTNGYTGTVTSISTARIAAAP